MNTCYHYNYVKTKAWNEKLKKRIYNPYDKYGDQALVVRFQSGSFVLLRT